MKPDKANEYFSAYFEGTLPEGLRPQFEELLENSPAVADEYASFVAGYESLEWLGKQPVAIPADLHETIMRRVDRVAHEKKLVKKSWFGGNLRMAWLGGLGLIAILATGLSLVRPSGNQRLAEAGTGIGVSQSEPAFLFSVVDSQPTVRIKSYQADTISVEDMDSGQQLKQFKVVEGQSVEIPIQREGANQAAIEVRSLQAQKSVVVVLPSQAATGALSGKGSVIQFARDYANRVQRPVFVEVTEPTKMLAWQYASQPGADVNFEGYLLRLEVKSAYVRLRD